MATPTPAKKSRHEVATTRPAFLLVTPAGRPHFNRCGIRFEAASPKLLEVAKLSGDDVDRIMNETMLRCRALTAAEAEEYADRGDVSAEDAPAEVARLRVRVRELEAGLATMTEERNAMMRDLALTRDQRQASIAPPAAAPSPAAPPASK